MYRVSEMFYDQDMPPEFMGQTSAQQLIRDPKLYTMNTLAVEPKKPDSKDDTKKPLVMRVSICCSSCVDLVDHEIKKVKGVKLPVEYDIYRKKVTVTGTFAVADVLSAARRKFKDAELWD